ncbi:uncharacterized protein LOC141953260 [Strix uralensis]|uniref:uncharacterized protein LOC141953260 n=1 Tax=Strix uralensis TaxID=36305 RepID=UPI003DA79ADC
MPPLLKKAQLRLIAMIVMETKLQNKRGTDVELRIGGQATMNLLCRRGTSLPPGQVVVQQKPRGLCCECVLHVGSAQPALEHGLVPGRRRDVALPLAEAQEAPVRRRRCPGEGPRRRGGQERARARLRSAPRRPRPAPARQGMMAPGLGPWLLALALAAGPADVTPSPSVYRLISKDDEDLEMCLITDYSPKKLTLNSPEKETSAIVEVATSENKQESSYLSTYWAKKDELQCGADHEGFGKLESEDPESGASTICVTGMSLHFKTDENLNMLSLSQLGLKIILMKGIIFNVLMTMLMWKKKN